MMQPSPLETDNMFSSSMYNKRQYSITLVYKKVVTTFNKKVAFANQLEKVRPYISSTGYVTRGLNK